MLRNSMNLYHCWQLACQQSSRTCEFLERALIHGFPDLGISDNMGVPKIRGPSLGGPFHKDCNILGSILGKGSGFRVQGLGLRFQGLGFGV